MTLPQSRAIKAGVTLSFGLLQLPVSLHSTSKVEDDDSELRTTCVGHGAPETFVGEGSGKTHTISTIRSLKTCPVCEATEGFGKAHPVGDGLIDIPADVLEAAQAADDAYAKVIDLKVFPAAEWAQHAMPTGKSYFLNVKGAGAGKGYALLVELLTQTPELVYVAMHNVRGAAHPYRLVADGDVLLLVQMADPELVRARPKVEGAFADAELNVALTLAHSLVQPFDPTGWTRPKLRVLHDFLEGRVPVAAAADVVAEPGGTVVSLMDMLSASVEAAGGKVPAQKKAPSKQPRKATASATAGPSQTRTATKTTRTRRQPASA